MNTDDAWRLIKEMKSVDEAMVENEREREKLYKEAINSRDPKQLISIMKTLYIRKQKRLEEGKKTTAVDERYFKLAENQLYSELAFALRVQKSELNRIIEQNIK
jgi:CarD family transcriptional regulator